MNNLFAPILKSSSIPFLYTEQLYKIYFSIPDIVDLSTIQHIEVKIISFTSNENMIDSSITQNKFAYPDGIYYKNIDLNSYNSNIDIDSRILIGKQWRPGELYKVQIRLGTERIYENIGDFQTWKQNQGMKVSEWSNVMIIKAISDPSIVIKNDNTNSTLLNVETNPFPLFAGKCLFDSRDKEYVEKYRFSLLQNDIVLEKSEWQYHKDEDTHRFKTSLKDEENYEVIYEVVSNNGYKVFKEYSFSVSLIAQEELKDISITVEEESFNIENACFSIRGFSSNRVDGIYVLIRASEKTNFSFWEDIKFFRFSNQFLNNEVIFNDFTIENGIQYQYALQKENANGVRSLPVYESEKPKRKLYFEYTYLFEDDIQLKLKFNNKINSFKHTTFNTKIDTLGSKYPTIMRNGYSYYAEFPISGLISLHMDEDNTFFKQKKDGYYYKNNRIMSLDDKDDFSIQLTEKNIYLERLFRDKVESFLNDGKYKLYKSPTEGNMIITLTNVSLTPNIGLGRMVYDFSATAYEVDEFSLEKMNNHHIISIGDFDSLAKIDSIKKFGQVRTFSGEDIISLIKQDISSEEIDENKRYELVKLKEISVSIDPSVDIINPSFIILLTNQGQYNLSLDKKYNVNAAIGNITSMRLAENSYPVLVDYTCDVAEFLIPEQIVNASAWGQLSGVFEEISPRELPQDTSMSFHGVNIIEEIKKQSLKELNNRLKLTGKEEIKFDKINNTYHNDSNTLHYIFKGVTSISIEAQAYVPLVLTAIDNSTTTVFVGPTEKYTLNPSKDLIKGLHFNSPVQALIDYKYNAILKKKGR